MLAADQGDALWIEYAMPQEPTRRVLVDAGTPGTWRRLRARIEQLPPSERRFELLVVSHIDADHIGGAVELLRDRRLRVTFGDIWFNGLPQLRRQPAAEGVGQGDMLSDALRDKPWNVAFDGGAVMVPEQGAPPCVALEGGLRLTVLSPCRPQLDALHDLWEETVLAHGLVDGIPASAPPELGPPVAAVERLPPATPSDVADLGALARRTFEPDPAVPNGSSIAVLAELGTRSALLCADAHAPVLLEGVARLLKLRKLERLAISALKLPHHGSRHNLHLALLERLQSRRHLISTNGSKTSHPHIEAIARSLTALGPGELVFNYRSVWNAVWDDPSVKERHRHTATYPPLGAPGGIVVDL